MKNFTLTTPVVLMVFNRPEETSRVFAKIREARPEQLLVIADGPRSNHPGEAVLCAEVRQIVDQVDWPCRVHQNYSDENLGCKIRVSSGLDWAFDNVDDAIILEDDCLPDKTFFRFCQELLEYYRLDHRIGMISGNNFQFGQQNVNSSYYFSKYFHVWGWATWRDRWVGNYDVSMKKWPVINRSWLTSILSDEVELAAWNKNFEKVYCGKIDTWDYQWVFANWMKSRLCILPTVNLISNIGFNFRATHTKASINLANIACCAVSFPLQHPKDVLRNTFADKNSQHQCPNGSFVMSIFNRVICRLKILIQG